MSINIMQWHARIRNFYKYAYPLINMYKSLLSFNFDISLILLNLFYSLFYQILLLLHGDVETNPGPNKKYKPFTCCHWNVNSLTAHNMVKLSSIAVYNTIHKYNFICISETYLDSSVRTDDRDILINGYNLIPADHPNNNKIFKQGDIQTSEGSRIDCLTTSYGFQQLISEPTHILKSSSSCIDLIFTNKPNLITDSGTHPSLHPNCHNITFCKINLKITILHLTGD